MWKEKRWKKITPWGLFLPPICVLYYKRYNECCNELKKFKNQICVWSVPWHATYSVFWQSHRQILTLRQPMQTAAGDNTAEITQAGMAGLELEVEYVEA